jgi:hypothetical protein
LQQSVQLLERALQKGDSEQAEALLTQLLQRPHLIAEVLACSYLKGKIESSRGNIRETERRLRNAFEDAPQNAEGAEPCPNAEQVSRPATTNTATLNNAMEEFILARSLAIFAGALKTYVRFTRTRTRSTGLGLL